MRHTIGSYTVTRVSHGSSVELLEFWECQDDFDAVLGVAAHRISFEVKRRKNGQGLQFDQLSVVGELIVVDPEVSQLYEAAEILEARDNIVAHVECV